MFKLKGKMLWLFALFASGLLAIGFYFYDSLNALGNKVEDTLSPNKRSDNLKKIMVDLNKLNNLYLVDSDRFNSIKSDSLIANIEKNVDSVKNKINQERSLKDRNLDTIPKLLRQIRDDYFELQNKKEQTQEAFINELRGLVDDELSKIEAKPLDSITIIKQINSEIYEKIELSQQGEDERGFFQRLFGSSRPENDTAIARTSFRDTLVRQSIDTVFSRNKEEKTTLDILPAIKKYQRYRTQLLNSLKRQEQEIFRKNIEVNNYVENTLNEILFEEYEHHENSIKNLKTDSMTYFYELGAIIFILILITIIAIFIIFKDINQSIFYQNKLKADEEKAKRDAIEKQKFLSTMSHELRTPLTSIIGYSDMLDDSDENVKSIKVASNYLYQMTNEILDMAKIQAGIIDIVATPNNLFKVFDDIKSSFKELIKNQQLDPIFNLPKEDLSVKADAHRLQQILYNLMHNALKYTEDGFIKLEVRSEEKNDKLAVYIEIEDSGIGMTEQELKTVFQDYQQAGTHKNKMKGTGLGLGIVQKLVKEMGGKLDVESEFHKGTSFKLHFEFEKVEDDIIEKKRREFNLPDDALKGKRIFILDDDKLIARLYEKLFQPYHPELIVFTDAKLGFEHLLDHHDYDLYLIDFKMPFMTGYELLKNLKKKGIVLKNTLVSTANVMLDDTERRMLDSFDARVFKPVKRELILEKVAKLLHLEGTEELYFTNLEVNEEGQLFNFKDLMVYANDDEDLLKDLVETLVEENDKELSKFNLAIKAEDFKALAEIIHKLSSRFAQVNAKSVQNLKTLELDLRENTGKADQKTLADLHQYWKNINEGMREYIDKRV
jgi:signal transduction histidine kinase/CheY-like chemotaxis protein/HPt (histidine-containing phosphotransfer) domain-containing protein